MIRESVATDPNTSDVSIVIARDTPLRYKRTMTTDSAGVRFPPPLIFLSFILIGLGISWLRPMSVVPEPLAMPFGVAFVVGAGTLAVLGFRELRRKKTTIRLDEPSSTIVKTGPYRFTRNPLYVALGTLHLGIGLWTNSFWVVLMLIPALIIMTTQIIAREEAYLERAFGDEYVSYKASVRRWI